MIDRIQPAAADQPDAGRIARGVARHLAAADQTVVAELPLASGRRADLVALGRDGRIAIVEIKSCRSDFVADRKWPDYLGYCDAFYFAVGPAFPLALLPAEAGVILTDGFAAEVVRDSPLRPLSGARRKAMLIRVARVASGRLQALLDPAPAGDATFV